MRALIFKFPAKAAKPSLYVIAGAGATVATTFTFHSINPNSLTEPRRVFRSFAADVSASLNGVVRVSRALSTIIFTIVDYKYSLYGLSMDSDEYREVLSEVHLRSAKRVLHLCEVNKGFYVKAGQFAAAMQLVPKEYSSTLSSLQDQAVPCNFKAIKEVLISNLGPNLSDIFLSLDEQPIAAASIAQVHRAVLKDHQEVAIKVQYPGLENLMKLDLATMSFLSKAVSCEFTTSQVLTMQFCRGGKVDDLEYLKKMGINTTKVAKALVEVFAEMIFVHGFLHGDPHPGNILVSPKGPDGFSLVLLDHGVYKEFDEEFRSTYCQLWKALVLLDSDKILQLSEHFGIGKYGRYFPLIFTGRKIDSKSALWMEMSAEEKQNQRQELKSLRVDISSFMESLPSDFLPALRTDGLLKSILRKLDASQKIRLLTYAKYSLHGLSPKLNPENDSVIKVLFSKLKTNITYLQLRFFLELLVLFSRIEDLRRCITKKFRKIFILADHLLRNLLPYSALDP